MGGLCGAMAASTSDEENGMKANEGESWEDEVKMEDFYTDAVKYWEGVPPTVEGMLGGFSRHSTLDISGSKKFLMPLIHGPEAIAEPNRVLDCGAGIGRVSKRLLLPIFSSADLVEQNSTFLQQAKSYLGRAGDRVERYITSGLQEFIPEVGRYDVIWCQWVLSHLSDDDLVTFLQSCSKAVRPTSGFVVVKENVAIDDEDVFDDNDSSVTRSCESFLHIFQLAGLTVVKDEEQTRWPKELFQVRMFALR